MLFILQRLKRIGNVADKGSCCAGCGWGTRHTHPAMAHPSPTPCITGAQQNARDLWFSLLLCFWDFQPRAGSGGGRKNTALHPGWIQDLPSDTSFLRARGWVLFSPPVTVTCTLNTSLSAVEPVVKEKLAPYYTGNKTSLPTSGVISLFISL